MRSSANPTLLAQNLATGNLEVLWFSGNMPTTGRFRKMAAGKRSFGRRMHMDTLGNWPVLADRFGVCYKNRHAQPSSFSLAKNRSAAEIRIGT
jgi:hypothetical protein